MPERPMRAAGLTPPDYRDPEAIARCVSFANEIGIKATIAKRQWQNEFLPGILIWRGALFVNPDRVLGYDDVLHDLGHLATIPACIRKHATGNVDRSILRPADRYLKAHHFVIDGIEDPICRALLQCGETEAIAWQFAAMTHLNLPLRLQLEGGTDAVVETLCRLGTNEYFGINGLQAAGMTTVRTFPKMIRWVRP
jgi:hypothetical protein